MRYNLVLITVDQMRRDCMSAAGHPVVETPNLDAMCRQGVRFTHAYSAVPTCIAARCALLTGLSQRSHGRVGYADGVPWDYPHTLPGELTRAGYQTQCVGKMHVYPARSCCGFENVILHDGYLGHTRRWEKPAQEGFEAVDDYLHWLRERLPHADLNDAGLECNSWVARPWPYEERYHPTNWCASQAIDFLRRADPTRPFFLHVSFVRPHSPLDPPRDYLHMYLRKEVPLPPVGDWADTEDLARDGLRADCKWGKIPPDALRRARAAYYGLITHADHQIGRLMQAAAEHGLMQNTVFLFTSDHGDMLGDHNLFRKAFPYEGSAGIPLVLYDPGDLLGLPQGSTSDALVELRDVMPTLLELAGAEIPKAVEGRSLLPILRGEQGASRAYLHGEHVLDERSTQFIVTGRDKYVWYTQSGREQYFDLARDAGELHDRAGEPGCQARLAELRGLLIEELRGREEGYTDGVRLLAGRPPVNTLSRKGPAGEGSKA